MVGVQGPTLNLLDEEGSDKNKVKDIRNERKAVVVLGNLGLHNRVRYLNLQVTIVNSGVESFCPGNEFSQLHTLVTVC